MAHRWREIILSDLSLRGFSTGTIKTPPLSRKGSYSSESSRTGRSYRSMMQSVDTPTIREESLDTLPYLRSESNPFVSPQTSRPASATDTHSKGGSNQLRNSGVTDYIINRNVKLPSVSEKESFSISAPGSRKQSSANTPQGYRSGRNSSSAMPRSKAASRSAIGNKMADASNRKGVHRGSKKSMSRHSRASTVKQALRDMSTFGMARPVRMGNVSHLNREAERYERLLSELHTEDKAGSSPRGSLDEAVMREMYGTDDEFADRWKVTNDIYSVEQRKVSEQRDRYRNDHSEYLRRKSQRLSSVSEVKQMKVEQLEKRLRRLSGADDGGEGEDTNITAHIHLPRLSRTSNASALAANRQSGADRSVKDQKADSKDRRKTSTSLFSLKQRQRSAEKLIDSIDQVISDVDSCIHTAQCLAEAGGGNRSELLHSNVRRLSESVEFVEGSYKTLFDPTSTTTTSLVAPRTSIDTDALMIETPQGSIDWSWLGDDDETASSVLRSEDAQWDNYYHSLISEFYTLKAMMTGSVDDSDAFDKKVFALNMEHGKCPVSWREIFSMARYNLRELVCYPYASDEQVQLLIKMENNNIYSAWQTEVMNRIKQKLHSIRNSLKLTLVGKKDGKLKDAVNKVRKLIREEKTMSAQTKTFDGEEQGRRSISLMQTKSRERRQKEQLLKEEERLQSPLHREYTKGEYISALARVKQRGYIDEKLRLLKKRKKAEGMVSCVLKKRQNGKDEHMQESSSPDQDDHTLVPFDGRGRRYPPRINLIQEFSLVKSVLVDKQLQNIYRFLVNKFIQSGYSLKDLLHDRRLYTTAIDINPGGSVEELRLSRKPLLCLSPELTAYFNEVCRRTVLLPEISEREVIAPGKASSNTEEEVMSEKHDSSSIEESQLTHGWLKNLTPRQLEEICRRIQDSLLKTGISQKKSEKRHVEHDFLVEQTSLRDANKDGRHLSGCAFVKRLKPAKNLETLKSLRASSLHRPVSPFSPKLLYTGEKRKLFQSNPAQKPNGGRKIWQNFSRLVKKSRVQPDLMVNACDPVMYRSSQQQSEMEAPHASKRTSYLSSSKPQLDSDSQSDLSTELSELSLSNDGSELELSSTGWTASSSSSASNQTVKSVPLPKRSKLKVSDLGLWRSLSL